MSGTTVAVLAFAYASRFRLDEVKRWFAGAPSVRDAKTHVVAIWDEREMAFAFDFGALVFVNVPAPVRSATVEQFWRGQVNEPHAPLREELLVEVRKGARVEVGFDRVRVPALTPVVLAVIATVIAQSVSIDHHDEDIQGYLDRIHDMAMGLARTGKPPRQSDAIVKLVGASIAAQVEILRSLALLDKPDLTWDDALADELHDKLRASFEIAERYRALETKIRTSRESVTAFLEMIKHERSILLEVAVVGLILVEVVMGVVKMH